MSDVLVAIFSYNRPHLLRLTMDWLLHDASSRCSYVIFDDHSDSECMRAYLSSISVRCRIPVNSPAALVDMPRENYHDRAARCAVMRRTAVDYFLMRDYSYLFFKDDDILMPCVTIDEAVSDFEFLQSTDHACPGALTLHGLRTHQGLLSMSGEVYSELTITGEANVLFSGAVLREVGNHFQPCRGGFADTQFNALREAGFRYYDRVWPAYAVQHLGFGPNSSTIHQKERTPFWNQSAYSCMYKRRDLGRPLQVPGFDIQHFSCMALQYGAEEAARLYMKELAHGAVS